jgi:hypothetical protein
MGGGEKVLRIRPCRPRRTFISSIRGIFLGVGFVCVEHSLRRDVKAVGGLCRCRVVLFGRKATIP